MVQRNTVFKSEPPNGGDTLWQHHRFHRLMILKGRTDGNDAVGNGDAGILPFIFFQYAAADHRVIMYAGSHLSFETWKPAKENPRMIVVDAKSFQRKLIWYLYNQKNRASDYLFLCDTLGRQYQQEISCVQPDKTRKSGHLPENWAPAGDAVHDAFDVLKMAYFAVDFAVNSFRRDRFRIGKSPALLRRWRAYDERHRAQK